MLTGMSVYGIELSLTFPTLLAKYSTLSRFDPKNPAGSGWQL